MKKKIPFLALLLMAVTWAGAQNLVLNNSLENYTTCPGFGQFGPAWINDWTKPSWGSSDYYHVNCPAIPPPLPGPHSGNGEAGIILYNYGTEYREYITGTFSQSLVAGQQYLVEFYLCLNNGYIQAVQEAGAYISDSVPGPFSNSLSIPVIPQVKNNNGILSYGWQKVSGYITATGGENHITIGNFNTDSNTTIQQVGTSGSYGAYYFVDDVYVGLSDSATAAPDIRSRGNRTVLFPCPAFGGEILYLHHPFPTPVELNWFDALGHEAGSVSLGAGQKEIYRYPEQEGLYSCQILSADKAPLYGRLIILKKR